VFRSTNPEKPGLYWVLSDGSGEAVRLTDGAAGTWPGSFSPDGKRLALSHLGPDNAPDVFTAPLEGDPLHPRLGRLEPFVATRAVEINPMFSHDGRWIAYASQESGRFEVYVRPFPGPGGRWQISTAGGDEPHWSRGSREIVFQAPDRTFMAVQYTVQGDTFTAGRPRVWSQTRPMSLSTNLNWDLALDGKRAAILFPRDAEGAEKPITQVTMLLNFFDEVRRRVGRGE
jgi:serine/threonine-protein kinase